MSTKLVFATLALAAFTLSGCSKSAHPAAGQPADLAALRVTTAPVLGELVPVSLEVSGTVRPVQRAALAARIMGTIAEFPVVLGQRVAAGDVLVRISAAEIATRVLQAQSQLNQVRRDLTRERNLLSQGASTADLVHNLEDRLVLTEAQVREAETMAGYTTIRAPFAGVVSRKPGNAGDLATPGLPLLELEGTDDFQIEAGLPESLAGQLAAGARVAAAVPAAGVSFTATLAELSSASDPVARTVPAKFTIPAGTAVRSGQFARIQLAGDPQPALLVPLAAVSPAGQLERVFVVGAGNRAILRLVKTGATRGGRCEILSGLSAGERVVLAPPADLREGRLLEVQP